MQGSQKKQEFILQEYWSKLCHGENFTLTTGHTLRILSPGHQNKHAGPDFLDACFEIDGVLRRGNVEMHCKTTDWISHGHSGNSEYDDVILHVVMEDDTNPGNVAFLPDIPILRISAKTIINAQQSKHIKPNSASFCAPFFANLEIPALQKMLIDAGIERLHEKCEKLLPDLIAYSGQKAFLAALTTQYGVPDNREVFMALGQRLFAYPDSVLEHSADIVLWGESGLLPDPAIPRKLSAEGRKLVVDLWEQWWPVRPDAGEQFVFKRRCRPYNSPERRIAALSGWAKAFPCDPAGKLKKIINSGNYDKIIDELASCLVTDDFWNSHTSFQSKPLPIPVGLFPRTRLEQLLIDVILPYLLASAKLYHDQNLEKQVVELYHNIHPLQSNQTIRLMHSTCFNNRGGLIKNAAIQQGMIHLYRKHCCENGNYCLKCAVYRSFTTDEIQCRKK